MLYGMKDILFCNMEAIHDFHRSWVKHFCSVYLYVCPLDFDEVVQLILFHRVFLPQLEQCGNDHLAAANCFVTHASQLEMYVTYCTYQAKSDSVFKEYCGFFAVSVMLVWLHFLFV